jgi:hypothetical protein
VTYCHGSDQVNHLGVLHICIHAAGIPIKSKVSTHEEAEDVVPSMIKLPHTNTVPSGAQAEDQ